MQSKLCQRQPLGSAVYQKRAVLGIAILFYIIGFLIGQTKLSENKFLLFFANSDLAQFRTSDWKTSFSMLFLSQTIFLLFVLILGLSAIGILFLPLVFLIKGLGFGVAAASLIATYEKAGLAQIWAFHWFPEGILLWMLIKLSSYAWPVSKKVINICFFSQSNAQINGMVRQLLRCYLMLQCAGILLCFANAQITEALSRLIRI